MMMWSSSYYFFASTMFFSFLHVPLPVSCTSFRESVSVTPNNASLKFPAIFSFGDSIVDQGNNNNLKTQVKCNFPPYGKEFMGGFPTGRFSNAKTLLDILAEELGIKELLPAYLDSNLQHIDLLTGVSFGSGASGYDSLTSKLRSVLSLSDQLGMFENYIAKLRVTEGEKRTNDILTNSLFLVVAGTVDLCYSYYTTGIRKSQYDVASYTNLMVTSASNFLQEIYVLGARKVAVFGVPPIGCVPYMRTQAGGLFRLCVESQNEAAQLFNTNLLSELSSLAKKLPQSQLVFVDIYNPILDIIQNPQNYGFEVVDRGCCGTGRIEVSLLCNQFSQTCSNDSTFLFWDSFHPTERGYRTLVDHILKTYINSFL